MIAGGCASDITCPAEACNIARAARHRGAGVRRQLGLHELPRAAPRALADASRSAARPSCCSSRRRRSRACVDYTDRATAVLFGDGAAAAVLSTRESRPRARCSTRRSRRIPRPPTRCVIPRTRPLPAGRPRGADVRDQEDDASGYERLAEARTRRRRARRSTSSATRRTCACSRRRLRARGHRPGAPPRQRRALRQHGRAPARPRCSRWTGTSGRPEDDVALVGVGAGLTWGELPPALRGGGVKYAEFLARDHFDADELLAFARGRLVDGRARRTSTSRLPLPPMLMVDRIMEIARDGPHAARSSPSATCGLDDWFFQCHFRSDPVQPGCLGVDAVWQLLGFFCAWAGGARLRARARLRRDRVLRPDPPARQAREYEIDVRRYSELKAAGTAIAIGDAVVLVDGEPIYTIKAREVGLFRGIALRRVPVAGQERDGREARAVRPRRASVALVTGGGHAASARPAAARSPPRASASPCTTASSDGAGARSSPRSCPTRSRCAPTSRCPRRSTRSSPSSRSAPGRSTCSSTTRAST